MPSGLDDKTLTGYLLGELSEAQQIRVEDQLFSDHECYDRLQALKAELTDQYVQGRLAPEQGAMFAGRFLATENGRDDALFARALVGVLGEREERRNPADGQPSDSWWSRLVAFFRLAPGWRPAMAIAMAALMIGIAWLLIERNRLGQRLETAISERDAAQSGARKVAQLEEEKGRANSRNKELDQEIQQTRKALDRARQDIETITRQSKTTSAIGAILPLFLAPGVRRGNERVERLVIVPQARVIQLHLLLEPGEKGTGYRAEVRTKAGTLIHSQNRLRAHQSAIGKALLVEIPVNRLNDGLYEVSLAGATPTGPPEIINYYDFGVTRPF
jgi:hypothetical protein